MSKKDKISGISSTYSDDFFMASFFDFNVLGFVEKPKILNVATSPAKGTSCAGGVIVAVVGSGIWEAGTFSDGAASIFFTNGSTKTLATSCCSVIPECPLFTTQLEMLWVGRSSRAKQKG